MREPSHPDLERLIGDRCDLPRSGMLTLASDPKVAVDLESVDDGKNAR